MGAVIDKLNKLRIVKIEYDVDKIYSTKNVEVELEKKYPNGKIAFRKGIADVLRTRKRFNSIFNNYKGLFLKLRPTAKRADKLQKKMREIYNKYNTCSNCKNATCCHLQTGDVDGYFYEPDRIISALNGKQIPLPKPVLVKTMTHNYLGCGYITAKGCLLGYLRPITCVNSECKPLKEGMSNVHKHIIGNIKHSLLKIEYTLDSVWNDITKDNYVVGNSVLNGINLIHVKNKPFVYEGKGKFKPFSNDMLGMIHI